MSKQKSPDSAGNGGASRHSEELDDQDPVEPDPVEPDPVVDESGALDPTDTPNSATPPKRAVTIGGIAAVVIVLDQLTKIWAASALADRKIIDLFWTARFNLHRNFGSAFGLGASLGRWLSLIIVGVIIGMLMYARSITDRRMIALFGVIVGGAIGNLIDRLFRAENGFMSGGVIDFIDFQWWPIFNVADMAVVCGAVGLMLLSLKEPDDLPAD